jgi:chemotaxis-related protein WspB
VLMLLLHIGKDVYAVDCDRVVEVVPLVVLKEIPHAPPHVAGVFDYRGRIVPVVDLCVILARRRCAARLSSRSSWSAPRTAAVAPSWSGCSPSG